MNRFARRIAAPGTIGRGCWTAAAVLLVAILAAGKLAAATGGSMTLPPPQVTPKSGLRITVDTTWVENYGYLPVRVTVTSATPTTADQRITFRFKAGTWPFRDTPVMAVDQDILLPEGAASASATVLVPRLQQWQVAWWDVLVDGTFDKELSLLPGGPGQVFNFSGDIAPRILVVADDGQQAMVSTAVASASAYGPYGQPVYGQAVTIYGQPTVTAIAGAAVDSAGNPIVDDGATAPPISIANLSFAVQRTVAEMPTDWLAYTGLDLLVATPDQLARIQSENPQAWQAAMRWVRSGGNLWLHEVGDDWGRLDETLAALETLIERDPETGQVLWFAPFTTRQVEVPSAYKREAAALRNAGSLNSSITFAWRPAQLGAVIVSQRPLAQLAGQDWDWLYQQGGQQLNWVSRHGTDPTAPNEDFANLLIPGVGLAPVTEFRILITLFVLVIGPLNYWFLKRWKRLHLLILTVPLAALLVTLALFGYAVVGDGLSTRTRTVSYTLLDQRIGEAASWARVSYYAGLAPSGGLEFPTDAAVYPINADWSDMSNFGGEIQLPPRAMQWFDKQYLTEGWLASRTPTQYLTVAARPSERKLDVASAGGALHVTNQLGATLDLLVLRAKDGRLYVAEGIEPAAQLTLKPAVAEGPVAGRLRQVFQDNAPEFPEGYQQRTGGRYGPRVRRGNVYYSGYGYSGGTASTSRMEQRLTSFTQPVGADSGRSVNLADGTYLAITRRGVEVATGLYHAKEESGFHVVEGRW